MPRARRSFERPSAAEVAAIGQFATTVLSDAMGRAGALAACIRPVGAATRFAGPALTVRVYPNDNLMCHLAVDVAEPGDVVVIDAGGVVDSALWGEFLTWAALDRGIAGVVLDGAARDREAITALGLPVFAAAIVPRGTHKRHAGDLNQPIACAGVAVGPGDIVVADADGVVVVPRARALDVRRGAEAAMVREESWRQGMAAGRTLYEMSDVERIVRESGLEWEQG